MSTHDEFLRDIQSSLDPTASLHRYADWLQSIGAVQQEEYVSQWAEYRADPGRKKELIKVERRLRDLRAELGDAWCDLVEGHTAVVDPGTAQSYGELLGRLDAFTIVSLTSADQLDFAAELWAKNRATDEFLTAYYTQLFETKDFDLVELRDWEEKFRNRLEDWLEVCIGRRTTLYDPDYRRMRASSADRDVLVNEMIRLVKSIAKPKSVSRVSAKILDEDKPIPRAFLFEGEHVTLALTLTVLD